MAAWWTAVAFSSGRHAGSSSGSSRWDSGWRLRWATGVVVPAPVQRRGTCASRRSCRLLLSSSTPSTAASSKSITTSVSWTDDSQRLWDQVRRWRWTRVASLAGQEARRTGRRPGPSTTREEILAAARESFAKRGYDATSLRRVAADAGVDPALVRRFFGSKEGLLVAALTVTFRPDKDVAEVVSGDLDTLGDQIIRYTLNLWEQAPIREMLVA